MRYHVTLFSLLNNAVRLVLLLSPFYKRGLGSSERLFVRGHADPVLNGNLQREAFIQRQVLWVSSLIAYFILEQIGINLLIVFLAHRFQ